MRKGKDKVIKPNAEMIFTNECMHTYTQFYHDETFHFTGVERTKH